MIKKKADKKKKIDFITMTVHKIKIPLSSVKLSLDMLLRGDFGKLKEEQKEIIEKIYQRNNNLIYLVNDLLNAAKLREKKYYNLNSFDFEHLVKSVVESLQEAIQEKKISLNFKRCKTELPEIKADKEKIFLAVENILNNAVRYTSKGGKITIFLESNGKNLELKIQDSGIGIPESEQEKLFTEFFRGENAMRMESIGSGLGLFIAKNIIEDHRGKIWFESKENKGSTFFMTLPIK